MKELGNVVQISNRGRIILRSHETPALGLSVFDSNQKKVGYVHDVFGPTKNPYVSVKFHAKNSKNFEKVVGELLYIHTRPRPKSNKKWGRRKRKKK